MNGINDTAVDRRRRGVIEIDRQFHPSISSTSLRPEPGTSALKMPRIMFSSFSSKQARLNRRRRRRMRCRGLSGVQKSAPEQNPFQMFVKQFHVCGTRQWQLTVARLTVETEGPAQFIGNDLHGHREIERIVFRIARDIDQGIAPVQLRVREAARSVPKTRATGLARLFSMTAAAHSCGSNSGELRRRRRALAPTTSPQSRIASSSVSTMRAASSTSSAPRRPGARLCVNPAGRIHEHQILETHGFHGPRCRPNISRVRRLEQDELNGWRGHDRYGDG